MVKENNIRGASEGILGPARFSNELNADLPEDPLYESGENVVQPIADHLDLIYGDFTTLDDMDELPVENGHSVFIPRSQNESVKEQEANSHGNGILIDSWDQWNDDTDFSLEPACPGRPD